MLKNLLSSRVYSRLCLVLCTVFVIACGSENAIESEEFSEDLIEDISTETRSGPTGCFEIVFPITIAFPDGTEFSANSMVEARTAAKQWKEDNPDVDGRPSLVYPIELVNEDGELITIESRLDLREVIRECRKENYNNHQGKRCFRLVFPTSIVFPDGTVTEFEDRMALKLGLREWRQNNPDAEDRPSLSFPIQVEMQEDGSIVTVNSKEELRALKEDCN